MSHKTRLHEIDLIRGIGVILMVIYHLFFDLNYFGILSLYLQNPPWNFLAISAQIIFISAAGLTFTLSFPAHSSISKIFSTKKLYLIKLAALALTISLITWLLFAENFVKFGILHFYVLATILTIPLHKLKFWLLPLGISIIAVTFLIPPFTAQWWLYPLGLNKEILPAFDYFPLLPWYGVFLLGSSFGHLLISKKIPANYQPKFRSKILEKIGKHSLFIYLLNQPIIALIILSLIN